MEFTDLTRTHWQTYDKDGNPVPLEHTTFEGKRMDRLAEFDNLLQRLKSGEVGYIRFYRWFNDPYVPYETCTMSANRITCYGYGKTIKHLENWVVLMTPIGGLELHSKRTGKHLFTLGSDPRPEWVAERPRP